MKDLFQIGDQKTISIQVEEEDLAVFNGEQVHPFYSTFALGRDAEWACRQFVLEMKDEDEEGIGTHLNIKHHAPALLGKTVQITATIDELKDNSIICYFEAVMEEKLIASGTQGQKILKKEFLKKLYGN